MDEPKNRKHGWAFWTAAALLMVVLYPLSVGPATWLSVKAGQYKICNRAVSRAFEIVYAPLIFIQPETRNTRLAFVGDLLTTYVEWWIDLGKR